MPVQNYYPASRTFWIVDFGLKNENFQKSDPMARMMTELGFEYVPTYKEASIIVFPGGADIDPGIYGEAKHPKTFFMSSLDDRWRSVYGHVRSSAWLKVGICRGAQFLNVMNEGRLWQDVDQHQGTHEAIYTAKNGERMIFDVTSTHHQMMRPSPMWSEMWASCRLAKIRDTGLDRARPTVYSEGPDPEVVFYTNTKSLCFQPHPEYENKSCRKLFELCLKRALSGFFVDNSESLSDLFQQTRMM